MAPKRDDNWIDGLRGVASFVVVTGHLIACFAEYIHDPALDDTSGQPSFFQLPIIRLCAGGRSAVAIFFIITGYVNCINPLKNIRNGSLDVAFSNLAKSAFMRTWRLVLPTAAAILIGWVLFECGLFKMAKLTDSFWISFWIRNPETSYAGGVWRLLRAETESWMTAQPVYNATLWTVPFFLHGSMMVYLTLLATAFVTPKARKIIVIGLWLMGWIGRSPIEHVNVFFGLFMAEIHAGYVTNAAQSPTLLPSSPTQDSQGPLLSSRPGLRRSFFRKLGYPLPTIALVLGMLASSFPETHPEWAGWSTTMQNMMAAVTPKDIDINRYWMHIGASLIFTGCYFSPNAQRILTSPLFNFLGRCSFPVYLMHDQIIRTVLVWIIYGGSEVVKDNDGKIVPLKRGGVVAFTIGIPVFYVTTYSLAYLWMSHLDPHFARMTMWLKKKCWREEPRTVTVKQPAWTEKSSNLV